MLGEALKGIPRDSYQLMSKVTTARWRDPRSALTSMRKTHADRVLRHHAVALAAHPHVGSGHPALAGRNSRSAAEKRILNRGASVHGLPRLRQVPGNKWLQVAMIRMNHNGTAHGRRSPDSTSLAMCLKWCQHVKQVKQQGMGVISMKLVGDGNFNHEDRLAAMRFAFRNAGSIAPRSDSRTPQRSTKPSTT